MSYYNTCGVITIQGSIIFTLDQMFETAKACW